jgi:hypothetical protein
MGPEAALIRRQKIARQKALEEGKALEESRKPIYQRGRYTLEQEEGIMRKSVASWLKSNPKSGRPCTQKQLKACKESIGGRIRLLKAKSRE